MAQYVNLWKVHNDIKQISYNDFISTNKDINALYQIKYKGALTAVVYEKSFPMNFRPFTQLPVQFQDSNGNNILSSSSKLKDEFDSVLNSDNMEDVDEIIFIGVIGNDSKNFKFYVHDIFEINGYKKDIDYTLNLSKKIFKNCINIKVPFYINGDINKFKRFFECYKNNPEIEGIVVRSKDKNFIVL